MAHTHRPGSYCRPHILHGISPVRIFRNIINRSCISVIIHINAGSIISHSGISISIFFNTGKAISPETVNRIPLYRSRGTHILMVDISQIQLVHFIFIISQRYISIPTNTRSKRLSTPQLCLETTIRHFSGIGGYFCIYNIKAWLQLPGSNRN